MIDGTTRDAGGDDLRMRPTFSDGAQGKGKVGIVFMRVVAFSLKTGPVDIGGAGWAHRVAIATEQRAGKSSFKHRVKSAIDGNDGNAALACTANRLRGSHLGRAAHDEHAQRRLTQSTRHRPRPPLPTHRHRAQTIGRAQHTDRNGCIRPDSADSAFNPQRKGCGQGQAPQRSR